MASLEQVHKAYENAKLAGNVEAADRLQTILYKGMGVSPPKKFEPIPEKSGVIGNTLKGIGSGAVGAIESAALGAATMLDEEAELKAREKIQSIADKFTPEGGDKDSKAYNVGSGLGSILGTGAATLAGGAVGGARGAIAAGTAAGVGTQVGEASERARAAGATQEQRNRAITNPMILGAGLLETIPYLKAVGKFSAPTANKLSKLLGGDKELKGLLDRARSAGTTGGVEALQELAQNTAQNLVEQGYNPDRELTEGAAASAGYGGATGAIFQLLIDVLPGRRRGATPQRDETGPESEADVQDEVAEGEFSEAEILAAQGELFDDEAAPIPETTAPVVEAKEEKKEEAPEAAPVQGDLFSEPEAEAEVVPKAKPKLEIPAEANAKIKAAIRFQAKGQVSPVKAKGKPKRADVLAEVIEANPTVVDEKPLRQLFRKALTGAGFKSTPPSKKEREVIQARATGGTQDATGTTRDRASVQSDTAGVGDKKQNIQAPAGTATPRTGRLESVDLSPYGTTVGAKTKQATLTRPRMSRNVPAPGLATTTTTPKRATGPMGAAARMEETRKTGYRDEVPDSQNPVTDADRQAVKDIVAKGKVDKTRRKKSTAAKPPARKLPEVVQEYLKDVPDPIDGIMNAINDVAIETTRPAREELEALDPTVAGLREARDVASAEKTLAWAKKNMSPEVGKFIDKKLAEKKKELEEKPPIDKLLVDVDLKERRRNRKRKLEQQEAQEEVLDQAQFKKAEKQLLKQLNEGVDKDKQQKTVAAKKVVDYMRVAEGFKKFATLPPEPKKSKAQKEVDEVVETLEEIEVYDVINDVAAAELGIDLNIDGLPYIGKDIEALGIDLSPEILTLLRSGKLKEALERVVELPDMSPRAISIAREFSNKVGDAKVFVADGRVRNPTYKYFKAMQKVAAEKYNGDKVLGLFVNKDGIDNTIILDPEGLTVHTLLHEMSHAVTVATLKNKGHPVTKQLTALYEQVKDQLPTAYGSENLLEFVAEAFSNPSFQSDLAKIYTKKDLTLSAWQRFANAVKRLLDSIISREYSPIYGNNALTQADALIVKILRPPVDGRGDGVTLAHMSTKEGVQATMGNLGKIQKAFKPMTKADGSKFGDSAVDFVTGSPRKLGGALLELAPMLAMVDIATSANAKLGKMAKSLNDAFLKQRADIRESDNDLNVIKGEFAKWADKQDDATITRFNDVVYSSTTKQIDVAEKKASDYTGDDLIEFNRLKKEWDALGPDGQKVYNDMRQAYRNQFARLKEAIFGDIDKASTDAKSATQVKNLLTKRLFDKTELSVYFPLLREGEYKLVYQLKTDRESDEDQTQVEMFTTRRAMKRRMVEVENDPEVIKGKVYTYETGKKSISGGAVVPPTSFVNTILVQLDAAGVDKEVSSNILELYIDSLPESAFAKTIRKRKNIEGYIPDALYTFNRKAYDIGRQIARLSNASNLSAIQGEINEFAKLEESTMQEDPKRKGKVNAFNDIVNQLNLRANYARNPKTEYQTQAQAVNRLAFMYTIGFNASSAIVNMSQIPLFIMPYLSAEYGMGNTGRAIKDAGKLITASSSLFGVSTKDGKKLGKSLKRRINRKDDVTEDIEFEGKASLENYFIARYDKATNSHVYDLRDDIEFPNAEVKAMVESIQPLVQAAADANQLDQSVIGSEINVDQSGQQRGITDSATRLGAWGFHNVENYNRQITLATTYLLALRKLETDKGRPASVEEKQDLAAKSLTKTQELNGGSVKETGARLAQTDLGSVALMYKNFGIQMYYNMFKSFKVALDRDNSYTKEERKIAMKQLAGVHLTSLFFAGVQGIPIYGAIKLVANMFMDDEEEDWDSYVRRNIGEGWYKGAVTKYSGADVSKRVSLGQLLFQTNRYNPDASVEEDIFFYLGGPAWSTLSGVKRGLEDFNRGNIERGAEGLVPAAFRNGWRGLVRYNREGAKTRRGDVIYDDFSAGELTGQVLGFAPRDYAFKQEQNMMSKGIERSIGEKRSALLKKYYIASRSGDWDGRADVVRDITAFNKRHGPTYGSKVYISPETIDKSMSQHMKQSGKMHNGVTLNPSLEIGLRMQQNEWDKGWQLF